MALDLLKMNYNPDVLTCLANLSSDEVFTPPEVAGRMLDMLPPSLFENPDTTFLDPAVKSGVFLREIAKRLNKGLERQFPDPRVRLDHIFKKQLFGIAITEITSLIGRRSLYCSKYPNSNFSVTKFDTAEGNIRFRRMQHSWKDGKCQYCGASQSEYDRDKGLESHAYEFIHVNPEKIFNMKFDVIIGNPPYQMSDGGNGKSAKPIYQHFVEQAKKLNPRYLSMIIPSRWFAGGKGLEDFRQSMLKDKHVRKLVDYENFKDVFPGVDLAGGACYFLWERDNPGICSVSNFMNKRLSTVDRYLDEYEIFIRQNLAVDIVKKVTSQYRTFLSERVSARKPFGLPTNYVPTESGIPCWFIQKIGLKYANPKDITDSNRQLDKWKLLIPPAPIAGQTDFSKPVGFYYKGNTRIAKPGECCTESYIIAGAFATEEEVLNFRTYLFCKLTRFLLLQTVVSQHVTKKNFCFVPDLLVYDQEYTDELLCRMWGVTEEEWAFIDSKIATVTDVGFSMHSGGDA